MNQTIEVNLSDVLTRLETKIDRLQSDVTEIKIDVEKLKAQNEQINKRIDSLDGRFNILTIGFLSIVGILVTGLLTAVAKLIFLPTI